MTDTLGTPGDILLVEDNPRDAELTQRALKAHNLANRLVLVEDGPSALDYLFCRGAHAGRSPGDAPRVVLLDVKLPRLSGLDVLRVVKSDPRTRAIPVVMVTSSQEDPDVRAAYDLGANSYVVKPVDFQAFVEAMRQVGLYWLLLNQPPAGAGRSDG